MTYVVGVAGPIGAGKSVVADELAAFYGGARRSFGGVVRGRAEAVGRPTDRDSLQDLGDQIIATDGWAAFCREVLDEPPDGAVVVVDGVRHDGAIDALIVIVGGERLRLVFVDAPRDERLARLIARDGITEADFDAAEGHPNERELPSVRARADLVIDNTSARNDARRALVHDIVTQLEAGGFLPNRGRRSER